MKNKDPKIAIVHDYFNQTGGGERVAEALSEVWPKAKIYTSIFDKKAMFGWLKIPASKIKTNFISKLPFASYLSKHYFFLYPLAFRTQSLGSADIAISVSAYASKFAKTKKGGLHICYLNTVPRFLWGYDTELSRYYHRPFDAFLSPIYSLVVPPIKAVLKKMDFQAAQRIDFFIANSKEVQKRIKKHYKRDSVVIYPPVDIDRFKSKTGKSGDYYLVVSRLGGYKKVDIVVKAFNKLGWKLKIVGTGPQLPSLKKIAKDNIELLGRLPDKEVAELLQNCKALIFPTYEDFGIVPVEAAAAGKSVLAYKKGGVLETLVPGITGEFFNEQTPSAIIKALKSFKSEKYNPKACREQARKFSKEQFKKNIKSFVEGAWKNTII